MVIFRNYRCNSLVAFVLFININMFGFTKNQPKIDTIRISFEYTAGYAIKRFVACYIYNHNKYQLQIDKSLEINIVNDLPSVIKKECIEDLLTVCNLYSSEEQCDFINITKEDYSNYIKILNDSLFCYYPYLQNFKKVKYELKEDDFLLLSCNDIINIIESQHHQFLFRKPCLDITLELLSDKGKIIVIEPQWYFEGTAWRVKNSGKELYVSYEYIMSFLRTIHFDQYVCFWERFNLLFQIAESIVEKID